MKTKYESHLKSVETLKCQHSNLKQMNENLTIKISNINRDLKEAQE
jgi:hypothetical protein